MAQNTPSPERGARSSFCREPALSRLVRHTVEPGETLESIARKYNLLPATLMGLNPELRTGDVEVDSEILIPPYNGIRVEVPAGKTWREVAAAYRVRADVLFEVNGCQSSPQVVFVPGVNWSPLDEVGRSVQVAKQYQLKGYPLPTASSITLGYGWLIFPSTGEVAFHSGLDLQSALGTQVLSVGDGTVAFAGEQGAYGKLVVVNHQGGYQTRYAQLATIAVKLGQQVKQGERLGTVGQTGVLSSKVPHLHFEVRIASPLGWIAEDPNPYLSIETKVGSPPSGMR